MLPSEDVAICLTGLQLTYQYKVMVLFSSFKTLGIFINVSLSNITIILALRYYTHDVTRVVDMGTTDQFLF